MVPIVGSYKIKVTKKQLGRKGKYNGLAFQTAEKIYKYNKKDWAQAINILLEPLISIDGDLTIVSRHPDTPYAPHTISVNIVCASFQMDSESSGECLSSLNSIS